MASGIEISAILRLARAYEAEGVRTVLARLVSVEGSHYRKAGARMLLAEVERSADLGAETAEEIALSIVAEIQAALSKAAARPAVGTT
jgi:xanthine/CO dehydrogenase XdhC/CoxF family maturation factor